MKRIFVIGLCLLLLLAGCKASIPDAAETSSGEATAETTLTVTELDPEELEVTVPKVGITVGAGESDIAIGETGKLCLTYTGNLSSVRYVTSAAELPEYAELSGYDDVYFQEHALLLVTETVTSGTMQVGIDSIRVKDGVASVRLTHENQGDMGTAVMTTWLLWAEVEAGLDYTWTVENPAVSSEAERA